MADEINNVKKSPVKTLLVIISGLFIAYLGFKLMVAGVGYGSEEGQQFPTYTQNQQDILPNQNQEQIQECLPNWNCGSWVDCNNGTQTRVCTDSNNCGITKGKPLGQKSCVVEKKDEPSQELTELSKSLKDLKKSLEKQSSINKKILQCTELCAGGSIDVPYIKNTCRSDCYQIYYYAGEAELDKYIEELK